MYDYDAGAIFRRLTESDLAGGEDFLDEFAYKKWIGSVLAPKGYVNELLNCHIISVKT